MRKYWFIYTILMVLMISACDNANLSNQDTPRNIGLEKNNLISELPLENPMEFEGQAIILIGNEFGNTYFEMKAALEAEHFEVTTVGVGSKELMSSCPNHENIPLTPDLNIEDLTELVLKEYDVVFIPSGKHHRTLPYNADVQRVLNHCKENQIFISTVCAGNLVLTEISGLVDGYEIASSSITNTAIKASGGIIVYQDVVEDGVFITGDQGGGQSGNGFEGAPIEALAAAIRKNIDSKGVSK